jgi:hypothetical protein
LSLSPSASRVVCFLHCSDEDDDRNVLYQLVV